MLITNGPGDDKKREILHQYRLTPVMHTRLLQGMALRCCCGRPLEDRYYQFDATERSTGKTVAILYAGDKGCAARFFDLSEELAAALSDKPMTPLPFFDPLRGEPEEAVSGGRGNGESHGRGGMHPLNKEVVCAINLTLMCWGAFIHPGSLFSKLLEQIRQLPDRPLYDWKVKAVNTAISKGCRRLSTMLDEKRSQNPRLRRFEFPLMEACLQRFEPPPESYL